MQAHRPSPRKDSVALIHEEITREIIGAFYEVYNVLGYGFLEDIYARALEIELRNRGLLVERQFPFKVEFKGQQIGFHRCDKLVERKVIVELKATELLPQTSKDQLRNYLAAAKLRLGMLLHFGPKARFYRIVGPGGDAI